MGCQDESSLPDAVKRDGSTLAWSHSGFNAEPLHGATSGFNAEPLHLPTSGIAAERQNSEVRRVEPRSDCPGASGPPPPDVQRERGHHQPTCRLAIGRKKRPLHTTAN